MKGLTPKILVILLLMLVTPFLPKSVYSEYGDILIDRYREVMAKVGVKPVIFPHWLHRIRFKCKVCHENIFVMQKGANDIMMASMMKGESCGKCHDGKVTWDLIYCDRCHSFSPEDKKEVQSASVSEDPSRQLHRNGPGKLFRTEDAGEFVGEIYQIGLGWHPKALDFPEAPKDKYGLINWVEMLKRKLIAPKEELAPKGNPDPKEKEAPFDMDVVMPAKTGLIEGAYFPHTTHNLWLSCENCHTKLFLPVAGVNDLTMSEIVKGNACGTCHGRVSFPLNDCMRCHQPKKEQKAVLQSDKKTDKNQK